ncbi:hypothetical protein [Hamadaea tsunoensis]|uniref:hypothetical protein n=1 Tax=Hamadaea tsunoensis TaxID=53368 RepID=UPI0012FAFE9D|nr:hypothetical protein [Hamadaea tsunoensis]
MAPYRRALRPCGLRRLRVVALALIVAAPTVAAPAALADDAKTPVVSCRTRYAGSSPRRACRSTRTPPRTPTPT